MIDPPTEPKLKAKSPRQRAEEALTFLAHETGSATVRITGMTLADIAVDLEQRLADAIADAEQEAIAALVAERDALRLELDELDTLADQYATAHGGYCGNAKGVLLALLERNPRTAVTQDAAALRQENEELKHELSRVGGERLFERTGSTAKTAIGDE